MNTGPSRLTKVMNMRNPNPLVLDSSGFEVRSTPKAGGDSSEPRPPVAPGQPLAQFASHEMFAMEGKGVDQMVTPEVETRSNSPCRLFIDRSPAGG